MSVPAISVAKTPTTQSVVSGQSATFAITVKNTGNVPLHDIKISDPNCGTPTGPTGDVNTNGILETTETWVYSCTANNVTQNFTNTVTVTGTPPSGPDVSDHASADVLVDTPSMSVTKTANSPTVQSGGTATFTITVANTGSMALSNVKVTDPQCNPLTGPSGDNGNSILDIKETWTYTCTVKDVTSDFTNTVTVTASPPEGPPVSDSDNAAIIVIEPVPPPARETTVVPTMNEWGMIIFMVLAGIGSIFYFRKMRR